MNNPQVSQPWRTVFSSGYGKVVAIVFTCWAVMLSAGSLHGQNIIYAIVVPQVSAIPAGSYSFSGTITTDGTIGDINPTNIISATLSQQDSLPTDTFVFNQTFNPTDPNTSITCTGSPCFIASATELTFDFQSAVEHLTSFAYTDGVMNPTWTLSTIPNVINIYNTRGLNEPTVTYGLPDGAPAVIATATSVPVPEPATYALMGTFLVLLARATARKRVRSAQ